MKKYRLFSALLSLALLLSLLAVPASAAGTSGSGGSAILDGLHIQAASAILVDDDYGEVLYEQNAHERAYPASITKVMTALLTLEAVDRGELSLDQVVTVSLLRHRRGGLHSGHPAWGTAHRPGSPLLCPSPLCQRGVQRAGRGGFGRYRHLCGSYEQPGRRSGHDRHPLYQYPRLPPPGPLHNRL